MATPPSGPFQKEVHAVIKLSKDGRPVVDPPVIRVRRQGRVFWTCAEGRWEVEIKPKYDGAGPFSDRNRRKVSGGAGEEEGEGIHDQAHTGGDPRSDGGAPAGARGLYRYNVRVWVGGEERTEDPEIVIGPEI